jgi:acyl dehydratase
MLEEAKTLNTLGDGGLAFALGFRRNRRFKFRMSVPPGDLTPLHFEDLTVGARYRTGSIEVTAEEIVAFARRYDPQPFHVDLVAAEKSVFGGLIASGWLTAALTMRLMVNGEFTFGSGAIGLGIDSLRWPEPVRAGDVLEAEVEILATRASHSRPEFGVVKMRTTTRNAAGAVVQAMVSHVLVPRRTQAPPEA